MPAGGVPPDACALRHAIDSGYQRHRSPASSDAGNSASEARITGSGIESSWREKNRNHLLPTTSAQIGVTGHQLNFSWRKSSSGVLKRGYCGDLPRPAQATCATARSVLGKHARIRRAAHRSSVLRSGFVVHRGFQSGRSIRVLKTTVLSRSRSLVQIHFAPEKSCW